VVLFFSRKEPKAVALRGLLGTSKLFYNSVFFWSSGGAVSANKVEGKTKKDLVMDCAYDHKIGHVGFGEMLKAARSGTAKFWSLLDDPANIQGLEAKAFACIECDRGKIVNASFKLSDFRIFYW
jgi:hypothetical protein